MAAATDTKTSKVIKLTKQLTLSFAPSPLTTVSIIGTAGRKEDGAKMTPELFEEMCKVAYNVIVLRWKLSPKTVCLVSGGAAWADHVAVSLFQRGMRGSVCGGLTLHLPCAFDGKTNQAVDTGSLDWRSNPGRVMNEYHKHFTSTVKWDTLSDIPKVEALGAIIKIHNGFHKRNTHVAASKYLIAFTWGTSADTPKDGGTLHTWNLARSANRLHIPLTTLLPIANTA